MVEDVLKYADYFSIGMRVEVDVPLAGGRLLRDAASIVSADRDLLELQLSRHLSPDSVILETGTDLFLRSGEEGNGYRCRAIFLRCDNLSRLYVRLAGEIIPLNEREYFRVDVFIPLSYRPYSGHGRNKISEDITGSLFEGPQSEDTPSEIVTDPESPFPVAANLSGAGVRINVPEHFSIDELLELTLYLPSGDQRIITLVGQVVHVTELGQPGDPHPLFGTALRFVSMDDKHRESLLRFIHRVQVEQMRRLREESLRQASTAAMAVTRPFFSWSRVMRFLLAILSLLLFAGFLQYMDNYRHHRTKGEIEKTFEDQIRKYIEQR